MRGKNEPPLVSHDEGCSKKAVILSFLCSSLVYKLVLLECIVVIALSFIL